MSDNPKHAYPWTDRTEYLDWLSRYQPSTGRLRKKATK